MNEAEIKAFGEVLKMILDHKTYNEVRIEALQSLGRAARHDCVSQLVEQVAELVRRT